MMPLVLFIDKCLKIVTVQKLTLNFTPSWKQNKTNKQKRKHIPFAHDIQLLIGQHSGASRLAYRIRLCSYTLNYLITANGITCVNKASRI